MSHYNYFINKTNLYKMPEINEKQFQFIIKVIKLEAEINQLDNIKFTPEVSQKKRELVKQFNKLTKRKKPETIYMNLEFKLK